MADHQLPAGDNSLVWLPSPYKREDWSLSCLVSEHVSMAARQPQAADTEVKEIDNELAADEVIINVEYLSVSSRESVTDQDVIDPASTGRSKRKRGNPWSENEHRQFLQGLQVHGKGKWKKISRDFVKTRSPVQVASHAQKFFDRHNSLKPKKRKSINDITSLPAAETLIRPHVYPQQNPHPPPCSSTYDLPPLPDIYHIFENYFVPYTTDLVSSHLTNQENKMQLSCHASYPPPLLLPQPAPLTNQDLMVSQVGYGCSMMEPQFHPYQSPFPIINPGIDHLSVPKLIDGDYDMLTLDELLPLPPL